MDKTHDSVKAVQSSMFALLITLALFAGIRPAAAQVTFTASTANVGRLPTRVVAADVNGDGKLDLISANVGSYTDSSGTLTVLTNDGGGVFGFDATLTVGSGPTCVVAADVNGDGEFDLISADYYAGTLTVLTNDGGGVFGSNATLNVGSLPTCVAAADVNRNGNLDLISASTGGTLTVLTNNGNSGFGSNATLTMGSWLGCVVAADLNGDGAPDLITANTFGNTLSVLTNDGSGVFGSNATLNVGSNPQSVAAADVNGDGKLELISANGGSGPNYSGTLTVLTNNGSGVFGSNATLNVGSLPTCVAAADVNGDGKLDLISANSQDNTLTVLTNDGSGVFGSNATLNVGSQPAWVVAVDVNGDGKPDLISANIADDTLTVLINTTPFPASPSLNIARAGNQVALFWPASAANYVLQSTTNLSAPHWATVTNGMSIIGVTLTNTAPAAFFRLMAQ